MTITKKEKYLSFDYAILSQSLSRVTAVKDFGVTLNSNLDFKDHVSRNVSKTFKMCGFIKHVCTSFATFVYIYCLTVFIIYSYCCYILLSITGSSDLFQLKTIQYNKSRSNLAVSIV